MGELESLCNRIIATDLLIVGSEGAGGQAAIEASKSGIDLLIITKGRIGHQISPKWHSSYPLYK